SLCVSTARSLSVITIAISMIRSTAGLRPVISMSTQTRRFSSGPCGRLCDIIFSEAHSPIALGAALARRPPDSARRPSAMLHQTPVHAGTRAPLRSTLTETTPSLHGFTLLFAAALSLTVVLRLWLASRQIRHVVANRGEVPAGFAGRIGLAAHQRAADYTVARVRLGIIDTAVSAALLLVLTLLGGLQWL